MATDLKYACWADAHAIRALKDKLAAEGVEYHVARKAVCTPLSRQVRVGIVAPQTWGESQLCKRPLTWYWASPKAGLYLAVSAEPLDGWGLAPQIVLRPSAFRPVRLPDEPQQRRMIERPSYLAAKPDGWDTLDDNDAANQQTWMRMMGLRGKRFEELFVTHCANHANFLEPEYFIERDGEPVPYSIGPTNQVCSACLEFFNVIGGVFRYKLVVPCPGAVIYAGVPVNRYIEVETLSPDPGHPPAAATGSEPRR